MLSRCFYLLVLIAACSALKGEIANTRLWVAPADVLRDGPPDVCFASTICSSKGHGESWELMPNHCGRSTCWIPDLALERNEAFTKSSNLRFNFAVNEVIEDCAPLVDLNPACKVVNGTGPTYPGCCPTYECPPNVAPIFDYSGPWDAPIGGPQDPGLSDGPPQ